MVSVEQKVIENKSISIRWAALKVVAFLCLAWNITFYVRQPSKANRSEWQKGIYAHEEEDDKCIDEGFAYDPLRFQFVSENDASQIGREVDDHVTRASNLIASLSGLIFAVALPLLLIQGLKAEASCARTTFISLIMYGSIVLVVSFASGVYFHLGFIKALELNPNKKYSARRRNRCEFKAMIRESEGFDLKYRVYETSEGMSRIPVFYMQNDEWNACVEKHDMEIYWVKRGLWPLQRVTFIVGTIFFLAGVVVYLGFLRI